MAKKAKETNPEEQLLHIPVGAYVQLKTELDEYRRGDKLSLPQNMNARDYNIFCQYLKQQREFILKAIDIDLPEPIPVPERPSDN